MSSKARLRFLLEAAANRRFTDAEEGEWARLLEDPANREELDRELAAWKSRFGVLLDYHAASQAKEPQIPAARLEALLADLRTRPATTASPKVATFRRWPGPWVAAGVLAACLTLVVWYQRSEPAARGGFEFGLVATDALVRGESNPRQAELGADWRMVKQTDMAALRAWSEANLPPAVTVRIWVDEEAGKMCARYRRGDGTIATAEIAIETRMPWKEQVRRFTASLPGATLRR